MHKKIRNRLTGLAMVLAVAVLSSPLMAQPSNVTVEKTAQGWQLKRDGKPYYVNGAGGVEASLELLAQCGGNSNRTWGVDDVEATLRHLDEAHANGISVALGIWIEHERHGFDYNDEAALQKQIDLTLSHVKRFKDHPAILVWGIGNEMEGSGANEKIWKHLEKIAQLVKKEDPNHPIMTVVAELGGEGEKAKAIHEFCPSIDIVGINSYGGTDSIPSRYRSAGGTKPYIVTEFGPNGPWEVGKNSIGAVEEPTSTQKEAKYRQSLTALKNDTELCLGSYAFLWGHKQEATATWFGLFLPDGRKTAAVDALTEMWGGTQDENHCPTINRLYVDGASEIKPGQEVTVKLDANDPDGDDLKVDWLVMAEADKMLTGGDFQETPEAFTKAIVKADNSEAVIKMPQADGIYRVYALVGDGKRSAASANVALLVNQEVEDGPQGKKSDLPFVVLDEPDTNSGYYPSGWMGNTGAVTMDENCKDSPKSGKHCTKFGYTTGGNWAGVVWQNPPDDWGDKDGGFNLSGAKKLTFWARGENGGEKMKFGFGLLGRDKKFYDTGKKETPEVTLTKDWKQYSLDLDGLNLNRIKSGFYWTLAGQGKPITFYLDRIVFEDKE